MDVLSEINMIILNYKNVRYGYDDRRDETD